MREEARVAGIELERFDPEHAPGTVGGEPVPAPRAVPGSVHEDEPRRRQSLYD